MEASITESVVNLHSDVEQLFFVHLYTVCVCELQNEY